MVISERRPGTTDVITRVPNREVVRRPMQFTPAAVFQRPVPESAEPEPFLNFLDFHHPQLEAEAVSLGLEHGRMFLDKKKNRTYSFLVEAQRANVVEKLNLKKESLEKTLITAWYYICTDASYSEIAKKVGFNERSIPQGRLKRFIKSMYNASPQEIRDKYDIATLTLEKRRSERLRNTISRRYDGKREEIKRLYDSGIRDQHIIAETLEMPVLHVRKAIGRIRRARGEKTTLTQTRELMNTLEGADLTKRRTVLKALPAGRVQEDPHFKSVRKILRSNGLPAAPKDVQAVIKVIGYRETVPYKKIEYWRKDENGERIPAGSAVFVFAEDEAKIIEISNDLGRRNAAETVDNSEAAM